MSFRKELSSIIDHSIYIGISVPLSITIMLFTYALQIMRPISFLVCDINNLDMNRVLINLLLLQYIFNFNPIHPFTSCSTYTDFIYETFLLYYLFLKTLHKILLMD